MNADRWTADRIPDLSGRIIVVTGAGSGLGLVTARTLRERGARVIAAVRRPEEHPGEARRLDLADLDSVHEFAGRMHDEHHRIDVLINNAGTMATPYALTPQGHELQFATNHLGHFALTGLLFDLLRSGRDPRVVTVTSVNHRGARLPFEEARRYQPMAVYNTTKLANAIFGAELHRRLTDAGSPIRSILAHPGYTATNLQFRATTPAWRFLLGRIGNPLLAQSADRGALPQLYAATDPAARAGALIVPDGPGELRGHPVEGRLSAAAADPDNGRRLWELSEQATGVRLTCAAS
ncbi:putative short-chain dehydrogenase [Actinoplanes missouriensis 431]|uniref:Putative short-chain dehydrogenase n=1 Tax=Actinoplanes missouriensis (strain ATCC 14538 / DSM 43046 / CBS 188.64 / JCM 3121 / NBRC 102363 / NCIMB 12654 / NRRL B-3342 / UNCC 431) TaxID=512565 RepID=I0HDW0_ACTM4|nr:oxidoreductase [Actinoplanes missouriensis]BAL91197.1 putative short-chain dehydrogenase [Actinoplanes missouriensis 431]